MKTSNKILSGALVLFIIALVIYNVQLKAEYLTGNYKKPHRDYSNVDIKDFSEIEINGASMMAIKIEQGKFEIRKNNFADDSIKFTKVGNRLVVNLDMKNLPLATTQIENGRTITTYKVDSRNNSITITCPKISLVKLSDKVMLNGKSIKEEELKKYYILGPAQSHNIFLGLFKSDSLYLIQDGKTRINLAGNVIKNLKATVNRLSGLNIGEANLIENAYLQINAGGELFIDDLLKANPTATAKVLNIINGSKPVNIPFSNGGASTINNLNYHISDSAEVTLGGSVLKMFAK